MSFIPFALSLNNNLPLTLTPPCKESTIRVLCLGAVVRDFFTVCTPQSRALYSPSTRHWSANTDIVTLAEMSSVAEKGRADLGAAPLDFIYACSVCGASFADIYEGHNETVGGLSDGINPKERLVTRLFLANCCHVFCSSHLEGGGK